MKKFFISLLFIAASFALMAKEIKNTIIKENFSWGEPVVYYNDSDILFMCSKLFTENLAERNKYAEDAECMVYVCDDQFNLYILPFANLEDGTLFIFFYGLIEDMYKNGIIDIREAKIRVRQMLWNDKVSNSIEERAKLLTDRGLSGSTYYFCSTIHNENDLIQEVKQ